MEFLVDTVTTVPAGTSGTDVAGIRAREAATSAIVAMGPRAGMTVVGFPFCRHPREAGQLAAMPSPPTAPGTVTEPIAVRPPSAAIRNASTVPLAPACT